MSGLYTVLGHNSVICGGEGLDKLLSEYFLKDVTKKQGCVVTHPKSLMKLTLACETTRKVLSTHATSECHVEALYEGNDYVGTINRVRFESVTRPWRSTWESHLDEFLATLAIDPLEIDRVCCIGGVLKSPRLLNVLEMLFTNAIIDTSIESDFAVAYGTALHSLQSQQHSSSPIHTSHAQYPLGLLDQAERFVSLVPKGAALPLQLKVVLDQPSQPTTAIIKFAEGKELLPPPGSPPGSPTTLSETTKSSIPGESHGLTTASSTHEDTYDKSQGDDFSESEEEGPEPIYLGTVLGEFIFQLASGIDSIELTLHIDEAGQVLLNGTAINKASGISESLTLTI
ncbi:Hsp70 protein that interacts with Zuo1p [Coelomomyces lativittatus]|nr:Hsp70 protein that interacts with Zuo1p [Coelomomyces lativittatus]